MSASSRVATATSSSFGRCRSDSCPKRPMLARTTTGASAACPHLRPTTGERLHDATGTRRDEHPRAVGRLGAGRHDEGHDPDAGVRGRGQQRVGQLPAQQPSRPATRARRSPPRRSSRVARGPPDRRAATIAHRWDRGLRRSSPGGRRGGPRAPGGTGRCRRAPRRRAARRSAQAAAQRRSPAATAGGLRERARSSPPTGRRLTRRTPRRATARPCGRAPRPPGAPAPAAPPRGQRAAATAAAPGRATRAGDLVVTGHGRPSRATTARRAPSRPAGRAAAPRPTARRCRSPGERARRRPHGRGRRPTARGPGTHRRPPRPAGRRWVSCAGPPPTRCVLSKTTTSAPAAHRSCAAARPAIPAPTTATLTPRAPTLTTSASTPGSVSGRTPWPRLNTCPGGRAPAADHRAAVASTTGHGANSTAGSRLPCTASDRAEPSRRLVERHAPVDADHVGPGLAHGRQQLAGADAEVDARHVGAPAASTRADRGCTCSGSRRAAARRPTSRTAARRPRRRRPAPAGRCRRGRPAGP